MYEKRYSRKPRYERIGEIEIPLPIRPDLQDIDGFNLKKREQKFYRTPWPRNWKSMTEKERRAFEEEEFNKRQNGYWFYNDGTPTYITGTHYFYLNWWQIDVGFPEYRDTDREFFLFWDYCVQDKNCFGMLYMKKRREGATYRSGCINYEMITSLRNAHGGIQSKTEPDAKKVFVQCVVNPWKKLPSIFRPIWDGQGSPKSTLSFVEPQRNFSRKEQEEMDGTEVASNALDSWIDYESSLPTAYDSQKLQFVHIDEFGKVDNVDILARWGVLKECLSTGSLIRGKSLHTSTIEDMGGEGLKRARQLWEESHPGELNENGRTKTGLYRFFQPAYKGLEGFIDEHGNTDEKSAKAYLEAERKAYRDKQDLIGLARYIRKYPFTPSEALMPNGDECLFNTVLLQEQYERILSMKGTSDQVGVRGNLVWVDGVFGGDVKWVPNPNGRYTQYYPPVKPNAVEKDYTGRLKPTNHAEYMGGADPYDFSKTVRTDMQSKGAFAIQHRANPLDPDNSDRPAMTYKYRPPTNKELYEDTLKAHIYYGCKGVIEANKYLCIDYFIEKGFGAFLANKLAMNKSKKKQVDTQRGGEYSVKPILVSIASVIADYIEENVHKIYDQELIEELMVFSIEESRKFDLTIAWGYALLGCRYTPQKFTENTYGTTAADMNIMTMYDYNGNESRKRA